MRNLTYYIEILLLGELVYFTESCLSMLFSKILDSLEK